MKTALIGLGMVAGKRRSAIAIRAALSAWRIPVAEGNEEAKRNLCFG